ncbi:eCIS core domain-containing protein [Streptomyces olivochromogenes]|uniref:eCIS core domain-containing protein n=1 Tax=Streptomyces olivochromogenes TaxID=1963 RepID=UPI001F35F1DA|nr:DUF4157 domain-containing protein [Streptomyces olivochromogenes]MCF3133984.1 DUF4157 domain-containing protein [Streptomyces olivochromogenes]
MRAQDKGTAPNDRAQGTRPAGWTGRAPQGPGWAAGVLGLQRLAGNAAVSRAVTAERHQHSAGCGHEQQPAVQRSSLVHQVLGSSGRPLDTGLGSEMSARFGGVDFSSVRVHTDAVAQRSAAEIGASAYTSRNHVVWDGRDKHTLAHELTHVIQQSQGPVAGADNGGGLRVSDPGDSYERAAEANAARVMAGPAPVQRAVAPHDTEHDHASADLTHAGDAGAFVQRRAETPARIGFEFQQLRSEVAVTASDAESDSDAEVYDLGARYYGQQTGLWYVVQDGENLEFVTKPFASRQDLTRAMGEIERVAKALDSGTRKLQKDGTDEAPEFEIGNVYVTVYKPDGTGQPQVNPDVPLDSLPRMHERAATDAGHFQDFYGVNRMFWRAERTREEVTENAQLASAIRHIRTRNLVRTFDMQDDPSAEQLGSVRGMLQVMASAAVHEVLFHTNLPKDQPLLLKTHMGALWMSLREDGVIGDRVGLRDVVALMGSLNEDLADEANICTNIVRSVMNGRDPVWAGPARPVDIGAPEEEGGEPTGDRKQVLVELRRVPILAIDQWPGFAAMSFDHFIEDTADRYHRDL